MLLSSFVLLMVIYVTDLVIEAGSAKPFVGKEWDMESFHAVDKAGNLDFSDGYDQSKAFGNTESGQTAYMNYVGAAGGWGGAMVEDNIYQTSPVLRCGWFVMR